MKSIIPNIQLVAVSSWLPINRLEMLDFSSEYGKKEVLNIINVTGIERVRIADKNMTSSDMCFNAAECLFEKEHIDRSIIDGLVFVSQTSDYILPSTSVVLQHRLGLDIETVCIDIHYGCSGFIYGAFQAALWISSGACKNVLVLAGDTTSRMINPMDKSLRMVFGDCGTASLFSKGKHPMGFSICSDGSGADRLIVPAGGFRSPISEETSKVVYDEDNNGRSQNDLFMDGGAIFNFALANVHKDANRLIEDMGWAKKDVGMFALHQANVFMVNYVRKMLKVDKHVVPMNVKDYGNTGPATIPLLFSDVCSNNPNFNLEKVIMSGFGVGLSWGSIAANLSETHFYPPKNK